jgi:hypothetical protein
MVFWIGILAGGLFAWIAVKIGFYETWAMLFNILVSIYVAAFLTPVILEVVPAAGETSFGKALTLLVTATGLFSILYGISYAFLTGQFKVSFPKIFDMVGAGCLGFLGGFLVWSFVALLVSVSPISRNSLAQDMGFGSGIKRANVPYIAFWCSLVDAAVSSGEDKYTAEEAISRLLENNEDEAPSERQDPNDTGSQSTEERQLREVSYVGVEEVT